MSIETVPINIMMPAFSGGGAENAMVRLTRHWTENGRRVVFVVNSAQGPLREQVPAAVEVIELAGVISTRRAIGRLFSWIARERPQLLVSVLHHPNIAGAMAVRLRSPTTAHVALVRNHPSTEFAHRTGLRNKLEWIGVRAALRSADMVGGVSESVTRDVMAFTGLGPDRVWTTFNAIPTPIPSPSRTLDGWPQTTNKVLVAIGRLEPQKDYPTLLRAFQIARRQAGISLVILGRGSLLPALQALASDLGVEKDVHFLGFDPSPVDYVARASAFVLASRFEGFPNVVAEALALGKTVVATDAPGGTAEILGGGAFGYLAPVGRPESLAATILKAIEKPLDPARLRSRAADFDTDAIAKRYDALFARALDRKSSARRAGGRVASRTTT